MWSVGREAAGPEWGGPPRGAAVAAGGMVASAHPAVSLVGARVLERGGNAADAALAMAAMCWTALPGQCGVGGDAFALLRRADGTVLSFGGSGFGPDGGDAAFYRERGLGALPLEGPLAVAAPGAIAALAALHAAAATRGLPELWEPAIEAALRGLPCTAKTRADIAEHRAALARDPGAAAVFLPGGGPPRVGRPIVQPELAETLRLLAADPACLYTGDLAGRAVEALSAGGAPFSGEEWAASGHALAGPSLTGRYRGMTVHQTPPPAPGWMVLQQAGLCDGTLAALPWLGAEAVGWAAGAAMTAFADRFARCASDNDAWRELLTPASLAVRRAALAAGGPPPAMPTPPVPAGGDTTSVVAVDESGTAVSLIHSLAFTFGARVTIPGTGVVLNNRLGRGAYLLDGHPNEVAPRRRPLHTLNAWLVTDDSGRLRHVGNTPGGDGQVQWNTQLLSHLLDHGADPAQAVAAPRFTVFPGGDADVLGRPVELRCESRLGGPVLAGLRARGHAVRVQGPWEAGGGALVVTADHGTGALLGAADPRQDGAALGV
ncbi:gamma-glutamyltranspeptidase [Streptosporangium violaceochromogenes]|nr:gamma-glutamyltranspeptidase [Streptosporangium violaceochromogenes]